MRLASDLLNTNLPHYLRAGARLNSRVLLAVEWSEGGATLRSEGYTLDVSPSGCLAILSQGMPVGQRLRLVNLTNGKNCDAVVIRQGHEGRSGWELGIELLEPPADFWGLEF